MNVLIYFDESKRETNTLLFHDVWSNWLLTESALQLKAPSEAVQQHQKQALEGSAMTQQNALFEQQETAPVRRKHNLMDAGRAQTRHHGKISLK